VGAPAAPYGGGKFFGVIYRENLQVHPTAHEVHPMQSKSQF